MKPTTALRLPTRANCQNGKGRKGLGHFSKEFPRIVANLAFCPRSPFISVFVTAGKPLLFDNFAQKILVNGVMWFSSELRIPLIPSLV